MEHIIDIRVKFDKSGLTSIQQLGKEAEDTWKKAAAITNSGMSAMSSNLKSHFDGVVGYLGRIKSSIFSLQAAFAGMFLGFGIKTIIDEFKQWEVASAAIDAGLKSTKNVSGMTSQSLKDLAVQMASVTEYEDDMILATEAVMLTFTQINKNVFPQTLSLITDISTGLNQDLKSSAIQVGKALQDPIMGCTALRRVGVMLTDQQEAMVKALVKSGNSLAAQKIIMDELTTEFGGRAQAAASTYTGQLNHLTKEVKNLEQNIGEALVPVLAEIATQDIKPLVKQWSDWAVANKDLVSSNIKQFLSDVVSGISSIYGVMKDISTLWDKLPHGGVIGAVIGGMVGGAPGAAAGFVAGDLYQSGGDYKKQLSQLWDQMPTFEMPELFPGAKTWSDYIFGPMMKQKGVSESDLMIFEEYGVAFDRIQTKIEEVRTGAQQTSTPVTSVTAGLDKMGPAATDAAAGLNILSAEEQKVQSMMIDLNSTIASAGLTGYLKAQSDIKSKYDKIKDEIKKEVGEGTAFAKNALATADKAYNIEASRLATTEQLKLNQAMRDYQAEINKLGKSDYEQKIISITDKYAKLRVELEANMKGVKGYKEAMESTYSAETAEKGQVEVDTQKEMNRVMLDYQSIIDQTDMTERAKEEEEITKKYKQQRLEIEAKYKGQQQYDELLKKSTEAEQAEKIQKQNDRIKENNKKMLEEMSRSWDEYINLILNDYKSFGDMMAAIGRKMITDLVKEMISAKTMFGNAETGQKGFLNGGGIGALFGGGGGGGGILGQLFSMGTGGGGFNPLAMAMGNAGGGGIGGFNPMQMLSGQGMGSDSMVMNLLRKVPGFNSALNFYGGAQPLTTQMGLTGFNFAGNQLVDLGWNSAMQGTGLVPEVAPTLASSVSTPAVQQVGQQAAQGALNQTATSTLGSYAQTALPYAGAAAGAYGVYNAYQSRSPVGGAVSGAAMGFSVAGPYGALAGAIIGAIMGSIKGETSAERDQKRAKEYNDGMKRTVEGLDKLVSLNQAFNDSDFNKMTSKKNIEAVIQVGELEGEGIDQLYRIGELAKEWKEATQTFGEGSLVAMNSFRKAAYEMEYFNGVSKSWIKGARGIADGWTAIWAKMKELQVKEILDNINSGVGLWSINMAKLEGLGLSDQQESLEKYKASMTLLTDDAIPSMYGELENARQELKDNEKAANDAANAEENLALKTKILTSDLALNEQQLQTIKYGSVNNDLIKLAEAMGLYDEKLNLIDADQGKTTTTMEAMRDSVNSTIAEFDRMATLFEGVNVAPELVKAYDAMYGLLVTMQQLADLGVELEKLPEIFEDMAKAVDEGDYAALSGNINQIINIMLQASAAAEMLATKLKEVAAAEALVQAITKFGTALGWIAMAVEVIMLGARMVQGAMQEFTKNEDFANFINNMLDAIASIGPVAEKIADRWREVWFRSGKDLIASLEEAFGMSSISPEDAAKMAGSYREYNKYESPGGYGAQVSEISDQGTKAAQVLYKQYTDMLEEGYDPEDLQFILDGIEDIKEGVARKIEELHDKWIDSLDSMIDSATLEPIAIQIKGIFDTIKDKEKEWLDETGGKDIGAVRDLQNEGFGALGPDQWAEDYDKIQKAKDTAIQGAIDKFLEPSQFIIDTQGMSDSEKAIFSLNKAYDDQIKGLEEARQAARDAGESEDIYNDAIETTNKARKIAADQLAEENRIREERQKQPFQTIIDTQGMDDFQKQQYELDLWRKQETENMKDVAGGTELVNQAYEVRKDQLEDEQRRLQEQTDRGYKTTIETQGMNSYQAQLYDLDNWLQTERERLEKAGLDDTYLAGAYAAKRSAIIEAWNKEVESVRKGFADITEGYKQTDLWKSLRSLNRSYQEQYENAKKLGISVDEVTAAYDVQRKEIFENYYEPLLKQIQDTMDSISTSELNPTRNPEQQAEDLKGKYDEAYQKLLNAKPGEEAEAYAEFERAAQDYLKQMLELYQGGSDYLNAYDQVMAAFEAVKGLIGDNQDQAMSEFETLSLESQQLTEEQLQAQIDAQNLANEALTVDLPAILTEQTASINSLGYGIDSVVANTGAIGVDTYRIKTNTIDIAKYNLSMSNDIYTMMNYARESRDYLKDTKDNTKGTKDYIGGYRGTNDKLDGVISGLSNVVSAISKIKIPEVKP